jgi:hypothetical protein
MSAEGSAASAIVKALETELSCRFMIVPGLPMAFSNTGEPYIAFDQDGIIDGGFLGPQREKSPRGSAEQALIALTMHIAGYCAGKTGALYWRVMPEFEQETPKSGWTAYARLLVSDRPVIWATPTDYDRSFKEAK